MTPSDLWRERFSNYGCGVLAAIVALALRGVGLAVYERGYQHGAQLFPAIAVATFAVTFLAIDLLYYVQHRLEHGVPVFWAVHSVHHQSEICDASVSLRVPMLASVLVGLFHLPLSLAGVSPALYLAAYVTHAAIVFLLHSRTPRWMDRAGLIFNTPYLHRLHHASNEELYDRNFGGVFILWDRLFGTLTPSYEGPLRFGADGQPRPLSPVAANLQPWRTLFGAR